MFDWQSPHDDVIDSRDLIEARDALLNGWEDTQTMPEEERAFCAAVAELESEGFSDWQYGATLIAWTDFTDYAQELAGDVCYEAMQALESSDWPMRHASIDWEAAADELRQDYTPVTFLGQTYLVRS